MERKFEVPRKFKSLTELEFKGYLQRDDLGVLSRLDTDISSTEKRELLRGPYVAEATRKRKDSEDEERVEVVIKFVREPYGEEAHKLLAERGSAPHLYGCDLDVEGWYTIVMDRVIGKQWSNLTKEDVNPTTFMKLEESIKALHKRGFFHGDLRNCNVMVDANGTAQVIDFDWAVKGGCYPHYINKTLVTYKELHEDVKACGVIEEAHDLYALSVLKAKMPEPSPSN